MNNTQSETTKYVLLSIQPEYADKIFEGKKTVELRKAFPKIGGSQWVIVYVSTPIKAIVGAFQIKHIVEENPTGMWEKVKDIAGITREKFDSYYNGINLGYGIFIEQVIRYPEPITLNTLRKSSDRFSPPQNFRYLDSNFANNLNLLNFESCLQSQAV